MKGGGGELSDGSSSEVTDFHRSFFFLFWGTTTLGIRYQGMEVSRVC